MKDLLLGAVFLSLSAVAQQKTGVFYGVDITSFDRRACTNDWHLANEQVGQQVAAFGFYLEGAGSCTAYIADPQLDTGFALHRYFEGTPEEVQDFTRKMDHQAFQGQFIAFEFRVIPLKSVSADYGLMKYRSNESHTLRDLSHLFVKDFSTLFDEQAFVQSYWTSTNYDIPRLVQENAPTHVDETRTFLQDSEGYELWITREIVGHPADESQPAIPLWMSMAGAGSGVPTQNRILRR